MIRTEDTFSPAFGNRPDALVGRHAELSDFIDGLDGPPGNRKRATFFIGQRGMGKTALLLELASKAESRGFITASVMANERMLDEIIQFIQISGAKYAKKNTGKIKGISVGALGFSFGLTFTDGVNKNYGFRVKLTLLCEALEKYGKGVLILVDEVNSGTPEMRELAATYQHLVGEGRNIAIAMAGLPASVSKVLNDEVLTFLNRANKSTLLPIPLGDIGVYYASVFDRLNKKIDSKLLSTAVEATRGYPYLLQLVGYYLLEYVGKNKLFTARIVELAIASAKREIIDNVYEASLKPLSRTDIKFLKAMAGSKSNRIADIKESMGASPSTVQQYRSRLIEAGIIASERRGELEFTVPYLDEYLRGDMR